jgi:hypothetical protein
MKRRKDTRLTNRKRDERTRELRPHTYLLIAICGVTVVGGFFFAGRQHFSSIDYGMKNSRLRRQIDALEAEKRRLLLARETSLSPAELKKAARKVGLLGESPQNASMAEVISSTKDKAVPDSPAQGKPLVIKTSAVIPAQQTPAANFEKTAKLVKPARSVPTEN